jgi:hypothetical protein
MAMIGTNAPSTIMLASLESFTPVMMGQATCSPCYLFAPYPSSGRKDRFVALKDYHLLAERIAVNRRDWPDQDKGGS